MRAHRVGCLPVVEGDRLVGIITAYDFLAASASLFEKYLAPQVDAAQREELLSSELTLAKGRSI
ncbi:MAG: hypothetical protein AUG51_19235 [Acidobacteria bacterium 13_1_20CM_3_53_8]|nr:MAG: hypothetical protein AUG51_19235 [Acidobacteria bacterium 13_1_20CM_3_53_8]